VVSNSGDVAGTPFVDVYNSPDPAVTLGSPQLALRLKDIPAPVKGKVKSAKANIKLPGQPNASGNLFVVVYGGDGTQDTDYVDNVTSAPINSINY
jgi:hypothetical protein